VDKDRLVADMRDPSNTWEDSARFFLNWNMADSAGWNIVPRELWMQRVAEPGELANAGRAALSIAPWQSSAALSWAAPRTDGRIQVECAKHLPGTDWVIDACRNAFEETGQPIIVDPKSPTIGMVQQLRDAGIEVHEVSNGEYVSSCAEFQNAVINGKLVHLGDQVLMDALRIAVTRTFNEAWVFSAKNSPGDISPLLAVTLAAWGATQAATPPPRVFAY
jgi:hypothetical protein